MSGPLQPASFWWKFEELGTAPRVDAVQGVTIIPAVLNGPFVINNTKGIIGNAMLIEGNGANMHTNPPDFSFPKNKDAPITICGWIQVLSGPNDPGAAFVMGTYAADQSSLAVLSIQVYREAGFVFEYRDETSNQLAFTNTGGPITYGAWYFVVLVFNPADNRAYCSVNNSPLAPFGGVIPAPPKDAQTAALYFATSTGYNPSVNYCFDEWGIFANYGFDQRAVNTFWHNGAGQTYPFGGP